MNELNRHLVEIFSSRKQGHSEDSCGVLLCVKMCCVKYISHLKLTIYSLTAMQMLI